MIVFSIKQSVLPFFLSTQLALASVVQPQTPLRVLKALPMSLSWYGSVQEGGNARQVWLRNYTYLTLNVNGWKCNVYNTCRIYNSCSCAIILTH